MEEAARILVLSDSHKDMAALQKAVARETPDAIIHLGDHILDALALGRAYPNIPLHAVRGNTDEASFGEAEIVVTLFGCKFLLTHGHRYHVKRDLAPLVYRAQELKVDVALFGHTHRALIEPAAGLLLCNPGCCNRRLSAYGPPSYLVLTMSGNKAYPRLVLE
ncbi:metallophosphoesterase [Christensenellaceae bacterium OttesenSCG-928-L17]|nr:metallophosphoesterase [Christensenellaceae bacterium OttesenSCG-928-L17]